MPRLSDGLAETGIQALAVNVVPDLTADLDRRPAAEVLAAVAVLGQVEDYAGSDAVHTVII